MADGHRSEGFLESGNVWVLIPLAALSIPILGILTDDGAGTWVVGLVLVVAAVTAATRHLLVLRHRLRLEELAAQERVALAERERFAAIDRLVEPDLRLPDTSPREGAPHDR